jgi:hypothetical protein
MKQVQAMNHSRVEKVARGLSLVLTVLVYGSAFGDLAVAAGPPPVTFDRDVLPILQRHCQACHRPGQVAPMSFLSYQSARPWAKAMKAAVLAKKMPPWFADMMETQSHILNDSSLKQSEIETLSSWVDGGAPEGNPRDAPAPIQWPDNGWLIKPDVIVRGPTYTVPATPKNNVIEWTDIVVPSGFTKDTWITSMELKPDHRDISHHICVHFVPHTPEIRYGVPLWVDKPRDAQGLELPRARGEKAPRNPAWENASGSEICYVPGNEAEDYRIFGAGKLIPANTDFIFRLHYTPNGKEVVDTPELGMTIAHEEPSRHYLSLLISSPQDAQSFSIPPHVSNWESPVAQTEFMEDVELVWMMPHMHLRGKDMKYKLVFPNGEEKVVLSVPHYDFNWQLGYNVEPIKVPKGTKLIVYAHYDNSENNKFNPDPNQTVHYGDMTWEEMMSPFFDVITDKNVDPKKILKRDTIIGSGA